MSTHFSPGTVSLTASEPNSAESFVPLNSAGNRDVEIEDDVKAFVGRLLEAKPQSRRDTIARLRAKLLNSFSRSTDPNFEIGCLPGERKLADELGVSRVPVREALTVLRTLGLIEVDHEKKLYRAVAVPLSSEGSTLTKDLDPSANLSDLDILRTQLQGHVRTVSEFCQHEFKADRKVVALARFEALSRQASAICGRGHQNNIEPSQDLAKINTVLSGAATTFGLNQLSDSLWAQLDILELSVAKARRETFDKAGDNRLILGPDAIIARAGWAGDVFQTFLRTDPTSDGFVNTCTSSFTDYVDRVVGTAP